MTIESTAVEGIISINPKVMVDVKCPYCNEQLCEVEIKYNECLACGFPIFEYED